MEGTTSLEREIARLRDEIALSPRNLELKLKYGHACLIRDWRLEALRAYQEVLNEEENAEARLALAKIYALQEYYTEAYGELRKLFNIEPMNLQGHILLHLFQEHEAVPAELKQHLEFVPNKVLMQEQCGAILADRDLLDSQIAEYTAMVFGVTDPEPMAQYCVLEARKCKERLAKLLEQCKKWGRYALDGSSFDPEDRIQPMKVVAEAVTPTEDVSPATDGVSEPSVSIEEPADIIQEESNNIFVPVAEEQLSPEGGVVGGADASSVEFAAVESYDTDGIISDLGAVVDKLVGTYAENDEMEPEAAATEEIAGDDTSAEVEVSSEVPVEVTEDEHVQEVQAVADTAVEDVVEPVGEVETFDNAKFVELLEAMINSRGVKSAVLYQEERGVVAQTGNVVVPQHALADIAECVKAWHGLHETMVCWTLESSSGMVYIHRLNGSHILIIDSASTNLGTMRLGVEKLLPSLNELL